MSGISCATRMRRARRCSAAGFAPTPISVQVNPDPAGGPPRPTGTGNVTAMLRRGYLEMLFKTADTPLGRELDEAIARYRRRASRGLLGGRRRQARMRAWPQAGFCRGRWCSMQRPVDTEDGPDKAAFTVARVEPEAMAEGRIQILTHHTEDTVWQKRWLTHPNGALALLDVVIAVADVDEAARRFARFTERPAAGEPWGQAIMLDRGRVQLASRRRAGRPAAGPAQIRLAVHGRLRRRGELARSGASQAARRRHRTARGAARFSSRPFPEELGEGAWCFVETAAQLPWRG